MDLNLTWPQIAALLVLAGFLMTFTGLVTGWAVRVNTGERADSSAKRAHERLDEMRDQAANRERELTKDISAAEAKAAADLADFRERVAKDYATNANLQAVENRIVSKVAETTAEVRGLGVRFDRFLEQEAHPSK